MFYLMYIVLFIWHSQHKSEDGLEIRSQGNAAFHILLNDCRLKLWQQLLTHDSWYSLWSPLIVIDDGKTFTSSLLNPEAIVWNDWKRYTHMLWYYNLNSVNKTQIYHNTGYWDIYHSNRHQCAPTFTIINRKLIQCEDCCN